MEFSIPIASTYLCESENQIKSQNWFSIQDNMCFALSNTVPNFKIIIQSKQQKISHRVLNELKTKNSLVCI